jgi:hypothetical protein
MSQNLLTDFKLAVLAFAVALAPACSNNYLESFATKTDNDSLYWAAQSALWTNDYNDAIVACTAMPANYISLDNVAQVCASAYAGRCGYSLGWMETNIPTLISTPPIDLEIISIFNTASTAQQVSDCGTAEAILNGIGTAAQRSQDSNMLMTLLTIYEMGVISSNLASNGAGGVTGGFNACTIAAADQQQYGLAFYDLNQSLGQLASVQFVAPIATGVTAQCSALKAIGYDLCNLNGLTVGTGAGDFNPQNLPAGALKGATSTLDEGAAFGLNLCGGNQSVATCHC